MEINGLIGLSGEYAGYMVSNTGRVFSTMGPHNNGKPGYVEPLEDSKGLYVNSLTEQKTRLYIKDMVYRAFCGPIMDGYDVTVIDRDPYYLVPSNLSLSSTGGRVQRVSNKGRTPKLKVEDIRSIRRAFFLRENMDSEVNKDEIINILSKEYEVSKSVVQKAIYAIGSYKNTSKYGIHGFDHQDYLTINNPGTKYHNSIGKVSGFTKDYKLIIVQVDKKKHITVNPNNVKPCRVREKL